MTDRTESNVPKKSPLSLQMDLSKFTLATEEEKARMDQEIKTEVVMNEHAAAAGEKRS